MKRSNFVKRSNFRNFPNLRIVEDYYYYKKTKQGIDLIGSIDKRCNLSKQDERCDISFLFEFVSSGFPEKRNRIFREIVRRLRSYRRSRQQGQIISLPVPVSSGYTERVVNGGEVISTGLEVVLSAAIIEKEKFSWHTQLNYSKNVSRVNSLPDGVERLTLAYSRIYDSDNQTVWFQVEEGGRIGDMYGTGYLKNENGQFIIGNDGRFIPNNELQKLGNYNPDFMLGINNSLQYGQFDLGLLLDWRQGGILVSRTLALGGVGGQLIETVNRENDIIADGVVNVGTAETPVYEKNTTAIPAETYYRQFYDRNHEENNVYSASYLKLRQFSLGYTFNNFLSSNAQLNVSLIGRNLFAISEIPHFDPEQLAVQGNRFVNGVEDMSYATSRSYGIKLGLKF